MRLTGRLLAVLAAVATGTATAAGVPPRVVMSGFARYFVDATEVGMLFKAIQ